MLSFKAGKLAAHFSQWQSVSGCKIEFDAIPSLNKVMVHAVLSETQTESVDTTSQEARPSCLPLVGDLLSDQGISKEASELILKSWKTETQKQHRTHLKRWKV